MDVVAQIGGDALQSADRDRLAVNASAAACRLARPVARAAENPRKDIRLPIEQIRFGVPPLGDEPDVLRNVRVRRTRPLAVDDSMVVLRIADVSCHALAAPRCKSGLDDRARTDRWQAV